MSNAHNFWQVIEQAEMRDTGYGLKHPDGYLLAWGDTVPTDGGAIYAPSCQFFHLDGSAGTHIYINEGTSSSCDFNPMSPLTAAQEALLGATAGTATASKAVIADAYKTARWGGFNTDAALTDAVAFATVPNSWSDGQYDVVGFFGGTGSDMGSGASCKVIRARHIVNVGTGNLAHETYGIMGQVVVKATTLQHLHAGVIGTFEGHTSGVVVNGSYAYGAAGVMARVGGGAAITATKPVCGMVSFWNGAALASGKSIGFGNTYLTTAWTYGFANSVGSVVADIKVQAEDANSLHCCIFSGSATDDAGIVSQVGADSLWADGSLYISCVDGAGSLWQKQNDVWVVNAAT